MLCAFDLIELNGQGLCAGSRGSAARNLLAQAGAQAARVTWDVWAVVLCPATFGGECHVLLLQFDSCNNLGSPRLFYSFLVEENPRGAANLRLCLGCLGVHYCRVFSGNGRLCNPRWPLPNNGSHDAVNAP